MICMTRKLRTYVNFFHGLSYSTYGGKFQVSKEQELKLTNNKKKFDIREEYFVCWLGHFCGDSF